MIRKMILSAVLATAAITGLALTPASADAASPAGRDQEHDHHRVRFEVQIRHHGHWDTYATYHDRDDARRAVWMLERQGRDARIEVERDRW